MAGNCSLVFAKGRLSLARERGWVRIDSNARRISGPLTFILSPCGAWRGEKERTKLRTALGVKINEIPCSTQYPVVDPTKTPSNCVFFACHPPTLAVLTS